jgi:phosphoribosylcarboxyaminoimidazole (NCAIR) mutase
VDVQRTYTRVFNLMVRRVVAVGFVIVGLIGALSSLPALIDPNSSIPVNGVPDRDIVYRVIAVTLPAVMAVFGVYVSSKAVRASGRQGMKLEARCCP